MAVKGGYAEVHDNVVTVLADDVLPLDRIDAAQARADLERAEAALEEAPFGHAEHERLLQESRWAAVRLSPRRRLRLPEDPPCVAVGNLLSSPPDVASAPLAGGFGRDRDADRCESSRRRCILASRAGSRGYPRERPQGVGVAHHQGPGCHTAGLVPGWVAEREARHDWPFSPSRALDVQGDRQAEARGILEDHPGQRRRAERLHDNRLHDLLRNAFR